MTKRTPFAAYAVELRKKKGVTQAVAAEAIGMERGTLAGIETGHDLPGRDNLAAMADYYGVSLDSFRNLAKDHNFNTQGPSKVRDNDGGSEVVRIWGDLSAEAQGIILNTARALFAAGGNMVRTKAPGRRRKVAE